MSLNLSPLFHWSPKRHRESILRDGLDIMSAMRVSAGRGEEEVRFPWICFGTTPSSAWGLILDPGEEDPDTIEDGEGWDLWQVEVAPTDDLKIRGDFAPYIREVRVLNSIPGDRIWWVAERLELPHLSMKTML